MDLLEGIFGGLDFISDIATNVGNWQSVENTNQANIAMNAANNAQNMKITEEAWKRDDTAIRRRVEDLKAAGLSPVLAAGSGAGVSAPIHMQPGSAVAPQMKSLSMQDKLAGAMSIMSARKNIAVTSAQEQVLKNNGITSGVEAEIAEARRNALNSGVYKDKDGIVVGEGLKGYGRMMAGLDSEKYRLAQVEAEAADYNYRWYKNKGIPTDVDADTKSILSKGAILGMTPKQSVAASAALDLVGDFLPKLIPSRSVNQSTLIKGGTR